MIFEAFSFSSIRASILSGAHSVEDHHKIKLELQPANIIDSLGINTFCFYVNKSFGILKIDFFKIVKALKKKKLNFDVKSDSLRELSDFHIIKFTGGIELIEYFQNISMNSSMGRPRLSENQLLRECTITNLQECKEYYSQKKPKVLCLDVEIQTNTDKEFKPTEFGLVYFDGEKEIYEHYLIEEFYKLKVGEALQKKFHFGKTKIVTYDEFVDIMASYLDKTDMFLAHSVNSENHYLSRAGISLTYFVDKVVDTQFLYKDYDKTHIKPVSLIDMLTYLKIPFKNLHNSGNDAAFTWIAFKKIMDL